MPELRAKVDNALDETRMLILGAQVLLGFQFQGALQPGFEKLPTQAQDLKIVGLVLMLVAVGLLLAPGAYHQIVHRGHDSSQVTRFTNRIAMLALLPFALGMGIDVYVASSRILNQTVAIVIGVAALVCALFFWYGLELLVRRNRGAPERNEEMDEETDLSTRIKQVLTEARVVLPGAQALLGFAFAAVLMESFSQLPPISQYVHLASLALIALSIVFLMAPAAFHRIVEDGEHTPRVHSFASIMILAAMFTLGLGIAGDFYLVLEKVLKSQAIAIFAAGVAVAFFYGLWFGFTAAVRARKAASPTYSR